MITVNGDADDYAIMKQVQQLKLAYPNMAVTTLDGGTNFSALAADETLYLISHGDIGDGDLRGITRADLLKWLTGSVPRNFGGIVILSCYSGLEADPPTPSLAAYLATGLKGHAATGTHVAGSNGFSFGTPEFGKSGRSSVLPIDLAAFYFAKDNDMMVKAWLAHKPTHPGGVLNDLGLNVNTGETIGDQLTAGQAKLGKTPEEIAEKYVIAFAKESKDIEGRLETLIETKIPGNSVATRADYLVNNGANADVIDWNQAIARQYELFSGLYLFASMAGAFTVTDVP
jgi:hypothetical protein